MAGIGSSILINVKTMGATNATAQMNALGASTLKISAAMFAAQTAVQAATTALQTLSSWVDKSVKQFRSFDKAMKEVSTILTSIGMKYMPMLTAGVEEMSVTFGKSADDMAKGLYDILSAAVDATNGMRLLHTATKAAVAGLTTVSTSVDVFTSIIKSYGMTVSQAANVSDILFTAVRYGKLRFEELASAMGYITPIAANAGVAFEEVAAALTTVTRQGLHVDMATRGLALAIQNIVNPTAQAAEAAMKYDVDMSGLALRIKGLEGFINELSVATKEYGMGVVPEMIRNMRSLRVIMALVGEEGIKGFTRDLGFMQNAAGATEEAMTKMMSAAQMEADIATQSMERLERSIGKSWHGWDMYWKKASIWWGTLLSGGDANKAMSEYEGQINGIRTAYATLLRTSSEMAGKGSLKDIMEGGGDLSDIPWKDINRYMELEGGKRDLGVPTSDILKDVLRLQEIKADVDKRGMWDLTDSGTKVKRAEMKEMKEIMGKYGDVPSSWDMLGIQEQIDKVNKAYETGTTTLAEYEAEQMALQSTFDWFAGGLDTLSQSINDSKLNILELTNAIKGLEDEVETVYTSLSGDTFEGILGREAGIFGDETAINRTKQFLTMATKYGSEFITQYNNLAAGTDFMDGWDASTQSAIKTINSYNAAAKNMQKEQEKLTDVTREHTLVINQNNLEMMKLQLSGMMRRRGNTRSEQRQMKKLQISSLQERIEATGKELDNEETIYNLRKNINQEGYLNAKDYLDKEIAYAQHSLYLKKDTRNSEYDHLVEIIGKKKENLEKYRGWKREEEDELVTNSQTYMDSLSEIAARPETEEMYRELYGLNVLEELIAVQEANAEFFKETNMPKMTMPESREGFRGKHRIISVDELDGTYYSYSSSQTVRETPNKVWNVGDMVGWQRGTYRVPSTGMAMVHEGESITPRGGKSRGRGGFGGKIHVDPMHINVNVYDHTGVEQLVQKIELAIQSGLVNGITTGYS